MNPFKLVLKYIPQTYSTTNLPEALDGNDMCLWNDGAATFQVTGGDA